MRVRAAALALVLVVGLGACSGTDAGTPSAPTTDAALLQQRRDAGIADCPTTTEQPTAVAGGLPDLRLECLGTGSSSSLAGLSRGRPMLVNLWAQWCGPCRDEAPILAAGHGRHGKEVDFVGIDVNDPQPGLAIAFAQEAGWTWPQFVDPEDHLKKQLAHPGLPHTLLVDASGRIVYQHSGPFASTEQLDQLLAEHLGVR